MAASKAFLAVLLSAPSSAAAVTCGAVKEWYADNDCCGLPDKDPGAAPGCAYDFSKPACDIAEPQAPRDLTDGAPGDMVPKQAVLTVAQADFLPLVNVHFHLGAEHKSEEYMGTADMHAWDSGASSFHVRPGFMCTTPLSTPSNYVFQHCHGDMQVGKSYEVHYVHSSAGYNPEDIKDADLDGIDDGLGGAANGRGILNPMIVVQGQVYQILPEEDGGVDIPDMLHHWTVANHTDAVMYAGSTTGTSHDNSVCSPYHITWHVDKQCHPVTPSSFDNLCKQMKEAYNMVHDLEPHGSRIILDPKYVVDPQYVVPLA